MPSPVVLWSRKTTCPDCSPPRFVAAADHFLDDVAVADRVVTTRMPRSRMARWRPRLLMDGRDQRVLLQLPVGGQLARDHRHHLVAVDHLAVLIDEDGPIGIAVERDSGVGAALPDDRL